LIAETPKDFITPIFSIQAVLTKANRASGNTRLLLFQIANDLLQILSRKSKFLKHFYLHAVGSKQYFDDGKRFT